MAVSREKLYEEVWAEPMLTVAARYAVSSSFLARVCSGLKVPRPPRGYWAQLKVGKAMKQPPLPESARGDLLEWSRDGEPKRVPQSLQQAPLAPGPVRRRVRRETFGRHMLLTGIDHHFENVRVSDSGYLKPAKRLIVDVFTSRDALTRILDTANDLFIELENRGHRVAILPHGQHYQRPNVDHREQPRSDYFSDSWRPERPTVVHVGTVSIGISLFELSEQVEMMWIDGKRVRVDALPVSKRATTRAVHTWTSKYDMANGRLCLRAYSPFIHASWQQEWHEGKPGDLRGKIDRIANEIERQAPILAKLVEEGQRQAAVAHERAQAEYREWQRQEAERRRADGLKASREQLLSIVQGWAMARNLEAFFEGAERQASELAEHERAAMAARVKQAREMFGGIDPLRHFREWKSPEER